MSDAMMTIMQTLACALSILLMGAIGVQLLWRLVRVLRGKESADGLHAQLRAPGGELALAAGAGLVSRLAVYLLAFLMMKLVYGESLGLMETLDDLWLHWDTRHYIGIAENGYTAVGDERLWLVFFPLFPLLMRAASIVTGDMFLGGLLVSLLCSCTASALVYDLGYMHGGKRAARLSVGYFLLNPMSVFLNCAYTEALFICLTLAAVCLLRRNRPWLAALCGMLTSLTRMPGVIIAGLLLIALLGKLPKRQCTPRAVAACAGQMMLVFSGLFIYWGINYAVTGDPFIYMTYQKENWFQTPGSFWQTAATTMRYAIECFGEDDWFFSWFSQLFAMFSMYVLLAARGRKLPFDLAAYSFVYVAVVLAPTWLLSGPRYLYALCALPLLQAGCSERNGVHAALLTVSALLLCVYTFGYTIAIAVL